MSMTLQYTHLLIYAKNAVEIDSCMFQCIYLNVLYLLFSSSEYTNHECAMMQLRFNDNLWGSCGLMVRESRSGRNYRWGSEYTAISPPSMPRLRCHRTPNCSPGAAAQMVCACTLDGLSMGHHTWSYVTSLFKESLNHF